MVARAKMPDRFHGVTRIYVEQAKRRNGYAHGTLKARVYNLARFGSFLAERSPEVRSARTVAREHGLAFRDQKSRTNRRVDKDTGEEDRLTPYGVIGDVRIFFHDGCAWSSEEGSPLAGLMPDVPPLKNRDFGDFGGANARQGRRATSSREAVRRRSDGANASLVLEISTSELALPFICWLDNARLQRRGRSPKVPGARRHDN